MVGLQWRRWQRGAMAMCIALLAGCGGGGGNGAGNSASSASGSASSSAFAPSSSLANMCTVAGEQRFVRSYIDEVYLWYREVPSVDASLYSSVTSYFYALLVTTPDPNGLPKDQFSFVVNAKDADAFSTGVNVGYGVQWKLDAQGRQRVALIAAGSPAADAGMARRNYRVTVEGLAERAHKAAKADRERARDSSEVAEATRMLARQVTEVKDALALERKLRKAIRSTVPPLPPTHGPEERNERPGTGASA